MFNIALLRETNGVGWPQFLQVINTLLEAGVDKDCATAEKWSPLHAAAEKGKLEAVRCLQVRIRGFRPPENDNFSEPQKNGCFKVDVSPCKQRGNLFRFHG